ncbi:TonB-dependent receptor plug domain-containing protein [Ferruginibacter albus]|uniref:TonB-dependent receptor plug domain-containing protein n=1 Tax=Ferruginibacter albus TaxID=2875540 RepID=UPI001CC57FEA|nr:TonB-dependent receptor [Ferruginibacter albus]UAY51528.1 TonB-dependent receptor [Ferruginibacter albus]
MSRKILTLVAMFATVQSFAQTDTLPLKNLDEVIFTANKVEQKQNTTGKVVTVITKDQIDKSTGKSVAEVLNEQAGVVINGAYSSPGTVQNVYMRGASTGRVLILMDGIPVNDPSQINNDFDLNLFSINDVERIEICKGAQSTLYGSDAIAGVINIITIKKNVDKPFNVNATAAGGSYNTWKGNLQLYGKAGKLSYTARYAKLKTDGFSAALDTAAVKTFDKDGYNGDAMNGAVQFQATKNLLLKSYVLYSQYKTDLDASGFVDDKFYYVKNDLLSTGGGFQFKNDVVTLTGNYQFTQTNRKFNRDSLDKNVFGYFIDNKYFAKTNFVELYASIKLGGGFTLLQGADYRYGSMNNDYYSVSSYGPYSSSFSDTSMSQGSMYASLLYNSNKLNVELGGRLNVHSRYGTNYTYTFNPSYAIDQHNRIFGSIASGFKAPSLYQLFVAYYGNPLLQPEKSVNYELGFEQQYKKFNHRIGFFYRDIDNGIDFNNVTSQYFNYVGQIVRGLEYEVNVHPTKQLSISGNYTYTSGTENSQSRLTNNDTSYSYLLKRPKNTFNINVGYQLLNGLYASINGKYTGSAFDLGGYQVPDVQLNNYFLLSFYAEYKFKKYLTVFGNLKNITDAKFSEVYGYGTQGFNFLVGVKFSY